MELRELGEKSRMWVQRAVFILKFRGHAGLGRVAGRRSAHAELGLGDIPYMSCTGTG